MSLYVPKDFDPLNFDLKRMNQGFDEEGTDPIKRFYTFFALS